MTTLEQLLEYVQKFHEAIKGCPKTPIGNDRRIDPSLRQVARQLGLEGYWTVEGNRRWFILTENGVWAYQYPGGGISGGPKKVERSLGLLSSAEVGEAKKLMENLLRRHSRPVSW